MVIFFKTLLLSRLTKGGFMEKKIISIPPNYFYLCIILVLVLNYMFPQFRIMIPWISYFAIALMFFGIYIVICSHFIFKKYDTPEKFLPSTCLVVKGLYSYTRNPMYLGGVIALFGIALITGNFISLLSPMIFFLIIQYMFIPYEEEKMEKTFGDQYIDYKKNVRRWI